MQLAEIAGAPGRARGGGCARHARRDLPAHRAGLPGLATGGLVLVARRRRRRATPRRTTRRASVSSRSASQRRSHWPSRSRAIRRSSRSRCSRSRRFASPVQLGDEEAFLLAPALPRDRGRRARARVPDPARRAPRAAALPARAPARGVRHPRVHVVPVDVGRARRAASHSRSSSSRSPPGSPRSRAARSPTGCRARCS